MALVPGLDTAEAGEHGLYAADAYDSLPTLAAAGKLFQDRNIQSHLDGPIRDIFLAHGAHNTYGVALLHKHFAIESTERLVEHNGVSTPWHVGDVVSTHARKWGGSFKPRSLRLFNGKLKPYEFLFGAFGTQPEPTCLDSESRDKFLNDITMYLRKHVLESLLGLGLLEGHKREVNVEITEGKANIMLPNGSIADSSLMPAFWIFGQDDDRCHCYTYCPRDQQGNHLGEIHGCG